VTPTTTPPATTDAYSCLQAFKWALISGIVEPLGGILVGTLLFPYLNGYIVHSMLAAVGGVMVYICLEELYPATLKYSDPTVCVVALHST
jgi:zinc transporter, ZIP family